MLDEKLLVFVLGAPGYDQRQRCLDSAVMPDFQPEQLPAFCPAEPAKAPNAT